MKCFLSCSFSDKDRVIRQWFEEFLDAFPDLKAVVADCGIHRPADQVEMRMGECQLACFVFTLREGGVPAWILQEAEMAWQKGLLIFAFVEKGIPVNKLGTLPSRIAFQLFDREKLMQEFPTYVKYTYNARIEALKKQSLDRKQLLKKIDSLRHDVEVLEHLLEPRDFDPDPDLE